MKYALPTYLAAAFAAIQLAAGPATAGSAGGATAEQTAANQPAEKNRAGVSASQTVWPSALKSRMVVTPASMLIGRDLTDKDGKKAGTIKFLLIRVDDGEIVYAMATPAGESAMGELAAVPWDVIEAQDWVGWQSTGLSLSVSRQKLEQAERYRMEDLFDLVSPAVQAEIVNYYAPEPKAVQERSKQAQRPTGKEQTEQGHALIGRGVVATIRRPIAAVANQLEGRRVVTQDGQNLGEIDEVMVDVDKGVIPYVLVTRGGFLGSGEEWVAIPPQALNWQGGGTPRYSVDLNLEKVKELPVLTREIVPVSIRRSDLEKLYSLYGVEPYWG